MIPIAEAINDYLGLYAIRIAASTLTIQRFYLRVFLDWATSHRIADLRAVTREHLAQYEAHLRVVEHQTRAGMKRLTASSRRARLRAVGRFFAWAVSRRLLLADPAASVKREKSEPWQPASVLSEAEMAALVDAPDPETPKGIRDRAILELLYSTGLRRAEIAALDLTDVDLAGGLVFVRSGKEAKQRLVPVGASAAEAIARYLGLARPLFLVSPHVRGLFLSSSRCGHRGKRLGHGAIPIIVADAARKAGITKRVTPHTLRHSFATHLLRAGADLRHVQELLGHSRIDSTERYTHLDVTDLAAAHARSHPRGKKRRSKATK